MAFAAAPEYHGVPDGGRAASRWTSTRRWCTPRRTRCRSCASCARMRSSRTSSRSRRRWRRSWSGVPRATLIPHVYPGERAGRADLLAGRAPAPHGARPRAVAPRAGGRSAAASSAGRIELNETRARLGLRPLALRVTAASATNWRSWRRSRSWSTRACGPSGAHVVGPADVGAARGGRRAATGRRPAGARRALDGAGP